MAKRAANEGSIRKKTVTKNGQEYTYWEARATLGRDPGTGKQIQRSFTGKTQKEVREKMQAALRSMEDNTYREPTKITLGEWLDKWLDTYMTEAKPRTLDSYRTSINTHIKPALGALRLQEITVDHVQEFCVKLSRSTREVPQKDENGIIIKKDGKTVYTKVPLSPKTVKNTYGVLRGALEQAKLSKHISYNPAEAAKLPKVEKPEIKPLDNEAIGLFLEAIKGHKFENVYTVALFTGMREGEVLGLTWDCIDFDSGTITVRQQLQKERSGSGTYHLVTPKNGKSRRITPASTIMAILKKQRRQQIEARFKACELWDNSMDLVFTNELGHNLSAQTVYLHFKKIAQSIDHPEARFHDLRHSYAVAALRSGDDIKTVQGNLGHATAAFTLDVYSHVTAEMQRESAQRMEQYISSVSKRKNA